MELDVVGDLLRRPTLAKQPSHQYEIPFVEMTVSPGATPPGSGSAFSCGRPVGSVVEPASIAGKFTGDRTSVPPQQSGDTGLSVALHPEPRNHIPFIGGELLVLHLGSSLLAGNEKPGVSQIASTSFIGRVALSL